jgi:hypothetical protein
MDKKRIFLKKATEVSSTERRALAEAREIWFVGVEPGGEEEIGKVEQDGNGVDTRNSVKRWLDGEFDNAPRLFNCDFKAKYPEWGRWPVDQKISKIISAYKNSGDIKNWRDYRAAKLYNDNIAYKINLFPLQFPTIEIKDQNYKFIWDEIGIQGKRQYYAECRKAYFPLLEKKYKEIQPPKWIVCFGNAEFFKEAFPNSTPINQEVDGIYYATKGNVNILIRPHLIARKTCNSNQGLIKLGLFLAE